MRMVTPVRMENCRVFKRKKEHGLNLLRTDKCNSYGFEDCYERANEIARVLEVELYVKIHINQGEGTDPEVLTTGKSEYAVKTSAVLS
ncbi:hypothetical protein [Clostridium sp. YIM B02569]|uniref:hypothetical protein n=1 Tax=Clostridium sp. YIM B02569 TaxID=2911967 RepID=UPI0023AEEE34|nr:hypothetical protein [Clostridium sp. YIM B02569]